MGYKGETEALGFMKGGLVGSKNFDSLEPTDMVFAKNINLNENTRKKRGGTAHVNVAAFTDTPQVMGIHDFRLMNGNQFIVSALKDGKIYKDHTTTIKTGMSTSNFFQFETFQNQLYICDGGTLPQTWDGAAGATANLAAVPTDWAGSNYPKAMIKHGRGASEQLWAFGCPLNNNTMYVSKNNDDDFSDGEVATINIETGDGFGIVAAIEFGDRLIALGKTQSFILDDSSSTRANWGYTPAQWYGGVSHERLICKTPNDIIGMSEDGEIFSVVTAEQYGDYKAASLTRPSDMHLWIQDNMDLTDIEKFHMVYDRALRAVRIFFVRVSESVVSSCLLYYIDRASREAWCLHDNADAASGYDASAAAVIRAGQGSWKIYTGDYAGNNWKLEESDKNDNGYPFYGGFKTPPMHFKDLRKDKKFRRGFVNMTAQGSYNLSAISSIDGVSSPAEMLLMEGGGAVLGTFVLGTDSLGASELIERSFDIGDSGKKIQIELYNSGLDENFNLSTLLIDYKPLGARAG